MSAPAKSVTCSLTLCVVVFFLLLTGTPASAAQQAAADRTASVHQHVRINPFARPLRKAPAAVRRGTTVVEKPAQLLQLRGVLDAGENSFANVDGTIVGLGEQVGDLRLIAVSDGEAVFERISASDSRRGATGTIRLKVRSGDSAPAATPPRTAATTASGGEAGAGTARQSARASAASQYVQVSEQ